MEVIQINTENENLIVPEIVFNEDIALTEESKRNLQKKEIIDTDEQYEVEMGIDERKISVEQEIFDEKAQLEELVIPSLEETISNALKEPQEEENIIEESTEKNISFIDADIQDEPQEEKLDIANEEIEELHIPDIETPIEDVYVKKENTVIPEEEIEVEATETLTDKVVLEEANSNKELCISPLQIDLSEEEYDSDPLPKITTEKVNLEPIEKTFIERKSIFEEKTGVIKANEGIQKKVEVLHKRPMGLVLSLILIIILLLICIILISKPQIERFFIGVQLSEEKIVVLMEEYNFVNANAHLLSQISNISEAERVAVDSYITGSMDKENVLISLENSRKMKRDVFSNSPEINSNILNITETKRLSDNIFLSSINITDSMIVAINSNLSHGEIINQFNNFVENYNSSINMYNTYVQNVFSEHGIKTTVEDNQLFIESSWVSW